MKKYRCTVCEWIYDPAVGDPDGGIAPGTAFEEIPEDWVCPLCGGIPQKRPRRWSGGTPDSGNGKEERAAHRMVRLPCFQPPDSRSRHASGVSPKNAAG